MLGNPYFYIKKLKQLHTNGSNVSNSCANIIIKGAVVRILIGGENTIIAAITQTIENTMVMIVKVRAIWL